MTTFEYLVENSAPPVSSPSSQSRPFVRPPVELSRSSNMMSKNFLMSSSSSKKGWPGKAGGSVVVVSVVVVSVLVVVSVVHVKVIVVAVVVVKVIVVGAGVGPAEISHLVQSAEQQVLALVKSPSPVHVSHNAVLE